MIITIVIIHISLKKSSGFLKKSVSFFGKLREIQNFRQKLFYGLPDKSEKLQQLSEIGNLVCRIAADRVLHLLRIEPDAVNPRIERTLDVRT